MTDVSNTADIIDSRDVIERIEELESERAEYIEEWMEDKHLDVCDDQPWYDEHPSDGEELDGLLELAKEGEAYAADWVHGEALIRDTYFVEYAQQLADDIGAVDSNAGWPNTFIDWDAAADALQMDYTSVDFDGVEYWIR